MSAKEDTHLQRIIHQGEYVLNCLLFGNMSHQIYKCLGKLKKKKKRENMNINHCFQLQTQCSNGISVKYYSLA